MALPQNPELSQLEAVYSLRAVVKKQATVAATVTSRTDPLWPVLAWAWVHREVPSACPLSQSNRRRFWLKRFSDRSSL